MIDFFIIIFVGISFLFFYFIGVLRTYNFLLGLVISFFTYISLNYYIGLLENNIISEFSKFDIFILSHKLFMIKMSFLSFFILPFLFALNFNYTYIKNIGFSLLSGILLPLLYLGFLGFILTNSFYKLDFFDDLFDFFSSSSLFNLFFNNSSLIFILLFILLFIRYFYYIITALIKILIAIIKGIYNWLINKNNKNDSGKI